MTLHRKQTKDRRIQKTRNLLHEALSSLIREKPYDAIVVREILDRANVGRSTFYMHFRDKDELLVSSIHHLLEGIQASAGALSLRTPKERILAFGLPIFEHIYRHRRSGAAIVGTRGRATVHEHLGRIVAGQIAREIRKWFQGRRKAATRIPEDLLVRYIASTFILVLNWWLDSRTPLPPLEADALFRSLSQPALDAAVF